MRITPHTFVGRPFERATGFAESKGTVLRPSPSAQKRRTKRSPFKIPLKKSHVEVAIAVYPFSHSDFFAGVFQTAGRDLILYIREKIRTDRRLESIFQWIADLAERERSESMDKSRSVLK
jgi:hypothetical protein